MTEGYRQIVRSTGLVGIGQASAILIQMVRVKALALIVGTAGMGIAGLYLSTLDVLATVSGMGIAVTGVRSIAAAEDDQRRSQTIATVRRLAVLLGVAGAAVGLALSPGLAKATFGTDLSPEYVFGMAVIALGVLFRNASSGQIAVLQGLRKIGELAAAKVLGAFLAAAAGIAVVWAAGVRGIPAYVVCVSAGAFFGSWFFARRYSTRSAPFERDAFRKESRALLRAGSAIMGGVLVTTLGAYLVRIMVQRTIDLSAVGLYQATWVLCSVYVGIVLDAMGADFFPRLSGVRGDDSASRRVLNEQMEAGILVAFPGVLLLLVLAPWVLELLYSEEFRVGTPLMRWLLLGVGLRAISWPLGYLVLSRNLNRLFLATQVFFNASYILMAWAGIERWGLEAVGGAFSLSYLLLLLAQWGIARHLVDFSPSPALRSTILWSVVTIAGVFIAFQTAPAIWAYGIGAIAVAVYWTWAARRLLQRLDLSVAEAWKAARRRLSGSGRDG